MFASYNDPNTPHMAGSVNQLLGVNNNGQAVGFYNDKAGNSHAYQVQQATNVFTAIRIPGAVSAVTTGINNAGDIVGFSTDSAGTTTSWLLRGGHLTSLAIPNQVFLQLQSMPTGTLTFGINGSGALTLTVGVLGFTPGSSHLVRLLDGNGHTLAQFSTLTVTGTGQVGAILNSTFTGSIPTGSRVVIYNGAMAKPGTPGGEIIAESPNLDSGAPPARCR